MNFKKLALSYHCFPRVKVTSSSLYFYLIALCFCIYMKFSTCFRWGTAPVANGSLLCRQSWRPGHPLLHSHYFPLKGSSTMVLCLETPAPPLETPWCCASKPQVRRASKPLGDKFWDQNFQVSVVFRPLRPKRAIPHPITIQNMRFRR